MTAIANEPCVAVRLSWEITGIVDPRILLDHSADVGRVHSVPLDLANEFVAAEQRYRELLAEVEACPRYRIVPALKLTLGDTTIAESTREHQ